MNWQRTLRMIAALVTFGGTASLASAAPVAASADCDCNEYYWAYIDAWNTQCNGEDPNECPEIALCWTDEQHGVHYTAWCYEVPPEQNVCWPAFIPDGC